MKILTSLVLFFAIAAPAPLALAQLSSENYEVSGQSVGGNFVSISSTSTSYAVVDKTGGSYSVNSIDAVSEDENMAGTRLVRIETNSESNGTDVYIPYSEIASLVLEPSDAISFCHKTEEVYVYASQNVLAFTVLHQLSALSSSAGHDVHTADIISPFYYEFDDVLYLYSGKNWTSANMSLFESRCNSSVEIGVSDNEAVADDAEAVPELEEVVTDLVYAPSNETVELYAAVGLDGLVRFSIAPGTFVVPFGADPDTYRVYIHVAQPDASVTDRITRSIMENISTDAFILPDDQRYDTTEIVTTGSFLSVWFTDSLGSLDIQLSQPLAVSYYLPKIDVENISYIGLSSDERALHWKNISFAVDERSFDFSLDASGVFSFWGIPIQKMDDVVAPSVIDGEKNIFSHILSLWPLYLLATVSFLFLLFLLMVLIRAMRKDDE